MTPLNLAFILIIQNVVLDIFIILIMATNPQQLIIKRKQAADGTFWGLLWKPRSVIAYFLSFETLMNMTLIFS